VRINGEDPGDLFREQKRRLLGTVPQDTWLFGASVLDNLTFGDDSVTKTMVDRACRISGVEEFAVRLPDGYDTVLSEIGGGEGVSISMGQRQLVALARALVYDPAVLLLDEATAAVDSETELAFKRALRSYLGESKGAVITIAHRLSTAAEADHVVVMEEGRITEEGPPTELIDSGGRFASLWELERAGWGWR
jgi:ATP-binding cassette subfamily B protein